MPDQQGMEDVWCGYVLLKRWQESDESDRVVCRRPQKQEYDRLITVTSFNQQSREYLPPTKLG